jgi:pyrimidine deaminase RibD-like protein
MRSCEACGASDTPGTTAKGNAGRHHAEESQVVKIRVRSLSAAAVADLNVCVSDGRMRPVCVCVCVDRKSTRLNSSH